VVVRNLAAAAQQIGRNRSNSKEMGKKGEEVNREEEVEAEEKEINNKSNSNRCSSTSRTTDANAFDLILTIKRSSRLVLSQFTDCRFRKSQHSHWYGV
jgi:protein-tyrosine-phosphatase